jgi:hypothetical protein
VLQVGGLAVALLPAEGRGDVLGGDAVPVVVNPSG